MKGGYHFWHLPTALKIFIQIYRCSITQFFCISWDILQLFFPLLSLRFSLSLSSFFTSISQKSLNVFFCFQSINLFVVSWCSSLFNRFALLAPAANDTQSRTAFRTFRNIFQFIRFTSNPELKALSCRISGSICSGRGKLRVS